MALTELPSTSILVKVLILPCFFISSSYPIEISGKSTYPTFGLLPLFMPVINMLNTIKWVV